MIKKLIAPLAMTILLLAACKKESNENPSATTQSQNESTIGNRLLTPPATFTQKMLFEMFGTVHCATCPDMEQKYRIQATLHPGKVFGYVAHNSDAMDIGMFDYLDSIFNVATYASGTLNRVPITGVVAVPKSKFTKANVDSCLKKTAACGVQITSSVNGNTASITVDAGFNKTMSGNYKLTVLLCEDSVVGIGSNYNQSNYYNTTIGSLWYGLGNPIIGYVHDFVPRKILSASKIGDAITPSTIKAGGLFTKTYSVSITGYNRNRLSIIAFINKVGTTSLTHQVMNVQGTKLGVNKNFD